LGGCFCFCIFFCSIDASFTMGESDGWEFLEIVQLTKCLTLKLTEAYWLIYKSSKSYNSLHYF
jgi:hypothetical protein